MSHEREEERRDSRGDQEEFKLFIGNLPSDASSKELSTEFERCGPVINAWVARNPPGFGFVYMKSKEDARRAIETFDAAELFGRSITVAWSKPRRDNPRRGRGGAPPPRGRSPPPRRVSPPPKRGSSLSRRRSPPPRRGPSPPRDRLTPPRGRSPPSRYSRGDYVVAPPRRGSDDYHSYSRRSRSRSSRRRSYDDRRRRTPPYDGYPPEKSGDDYYRRRDYDSHHSDERLRYHSRRGDYRHDREHRRRSRSHSPPPSPPRRRSRDDIGRSRPPRAGYERRPEPSERRYSQTYSGDETSRRTSPPKKISNGLPADISHHRREDADGDKYMGSQTEPAGGSYVERIDTNEA